MEYSVYLWFLFNSSENSGKRSNTVFMQYEIPGKLIKLTALLGQVGEDYTQGE